MDPCVYILEAGPEKRTDNGSRIILVELLLLLLIYYGFSSGLVGDVAVEVRLVSSSSIRLSPEEGRRLS